MGVGEVGRRGRGKLGAAASDGRSRLERFRGQEAYEVTGGGVGIVDSIRRGRGC